MSGLEFGDPTHGNSGPGGPLHPVWCDLSLCTALEHVGRPVTINSLEGFASIIAQLRQGIPRAAVPTVLISDGTVRIGMTVQQARALTHIMRAMVRQAGGPR